MSFSFSGSQLQFISSSQHLSTQMSIKSKYTPTEIVIRCNNDDYPDIFEDAEDEKKSEILGDDVQKLKGNIPPSPVTFKFVGIRPSKFHKNIIQINGAKAVQITFNSWTLNSTVSALKQCICEEFGLPKSRSLLLLYGNVKLSENEASLKEYGVTDHSLFILATYDNISTNHRDAVIAEKNECDVIRSRREREQLRRERDMLAAQQRYGRIHCGLHPAPKQRKKPIVKEMNVLQQIKHLEQMSIQRVKALDIITQEMDTKCLKLPICGHPMSQQSLYKFVLFQFRDKHRVITCPHDDCQQVFAYPVIKQLLLSQCENDTFADCQRLLSDIKEFLSSTNGVDLKSSVLNEFRTFDFADLELLSARNVLLFDNEIELQKCRDCNSLLYRNCADGNYQNETQCPFCVSSKFCWCCSEKFVDGHMCDMTFKFCFYECV